MSRLYIADAFTDRPFGGNPAGVVILKEGDDFPADEIMRKTAAELRYSETAFIRPLSSDEVRQAIEEMGPALTVRPSDIDGGFQIRYFTPAAEVDLCGHATIASFKCLREAEICDVGGTYINRTLAGDLIIDVSSDTVLMDMAEPKHISTIREPKELQELYQVMGIDYCDIDLLPQLISTGLPDIMLPVASAEVLESIDPDFPALAELSRKYDVVGVHAFALAREGEKITARCRNFAPLYDIDEEAATGTANGALTYYLIRNGLCKKDKCRFIQGEAMGRPSEIRSTICRDENGLQIRVGGSAAILVKGKIHFKDLL